MERKGLISANNINFPHGEAAVEKFAKQRWASPAHIEAVRELFQSYFEEELTNSAIFETEDGVAFPYTKINVTEFAQKIYQNPSPAPESAPSPKIKKYFVFGSFLNTKNGQFTFTETAMHEYMKALPSILKQLEINAKPDRELKDGEEKKAPDIVEIYTVGSPTSQFGKVTPKFVNSLRETSYSRFGRVYADFVASALSIDSKEKARTIITLQGYSMGASFAAAAAERLIEDEVATQDAHNQLKNLPHLQVIMDFPSGYHKPWVGPRRRFQTSAGIIIDGVSTMMRAEGRKAVLGEKTFITEIENNLQGQGYRVFLDNGQKEMKGKTIKIVLDKLRSGVPFNTNRVRANVRIGIWDKTMFSLEFFRKVIKRKREISRLSKIPIGKDIIDTGDNTRTFAINTNHMVPFFNKNELRRWRHAADVYTKLKNLGKIGKSPN